MTEDTLLPFNLPAVKRKKVNKAADGENKPEEQSAPQTTDLRSRVWSFIQNGGERVGAYRLEQDTN